MVDGIKSERWAPSPQNDWAASVGICMFLAEKGISVPLVSVDLAAGEQHQDVYLAINPRRVVPTLVLEDGTAIGEVLAIWRYLDETHPTAPLLGATPKEKAMAK